MSRFVAGDDFPRFDDHDHADDDLAYRMEGYDALVDKLMNLKGYDRSEAEATALEILLDDAA